MRRVLASITASIALATGALVLAAPAATGASTSDAQAAFAVVRTAIERLAAGRAADAWPLLVPAQQERIPQSAYVACRAPSGTLPVKRVRLLRSTRDRITIPGTSVRTAALGLTVRITLTNGQAESILTQAIKVGGSWRYSLTAGEMRRCRVG